jgi:uncharacterized iron-regulated membrane protein
MTHTVVDRSVDEVTDRATRTRAETSAGQWRPLLVRLHFYAGVLAAPFVFLACLTGMIYVFNPQLDRLMEPELLVVHDAGRPALPLGEQVARAVAAAPGLNLVSVVPQARPDETTRVNFYRPGGPPMTNHTVFVNPYTGEVQGKKDVSSMGGAMPFSTWMAQFHGDLNLGEFGRWYSEAASLWIVVLTLGGIVVWWQRCAVHRSIVSAGFWKKFTIVDRGKRPGVKRTLSWHSTIGVWTAVLAVLFGLSGLPFARSSGPKWMSITSGTSSMHRASVTLDTTLPPPPGLDPTAGHYMPDGTWMSNADVPNPQAAATHGQGAGQRMGSGQGTGSQSTSGHSASSHGAGGGMGGMSGMAVNTGMPSNARADFDAMAAAARTVGVTQKIRITGPSRPGTGWTVAENKQDWPIALDSALIDPATSTVVRTLDWKARASTWDKINRYIMLFHFGRLFGLVGQVIFGLTMLGVLLVTWWGYTMWWRRRPRGSAWRFGKVPVRGAWRKAPKVPLVSWTALTLVTFWIFPVLGVSALAFLLLDVVLGRIQALRKARAAAAG